MKKSLSLFLCVLLLLCVLSPGPSARALEEVSISAPSALLMEVDSGAVIYDKNAYEVRFPASITKIMTILLACEYIEAGIVEEDEIVTVTEDAWYGMDEDSSNLFITAGEEIRFIDLMYCAMLASANEACNAIAIHTCHDIDTFVKEMNRRAAILGCKDTRFVATNGLHDDEHYTTAYDMAVITKEAITHPLFKKIFGTPSYTVPATNLNKERYMYNTNRLMNREHESYYEYCTGGKTGSTSQAGYCLVSTAEKDGIRFICVVLGDIRVDSEDGETFTVMSYPDSAALFQWGFDNYSYQPVLSVRDVVASIPVYMGDGADAVDMVPTEDVILFVPNDGPGADLNVSYTLYDNAASGRLRAPVSKGEALGEVTVYYKDQIVATIKGVAESSVGLKHSEYLRTELSTTLSLGWVKKAIAFFIGVFVLYGIYIVLYLVLRSLRRRRQFVRAQDAAVHVRSVNYPSESHPAPKPKAPSDLPLQYTGSRTASFHPEALQELQSDALEEPRLVTELKTEENAEAQDEETAEEIGIVPAEQSPSASESTPEAEEASSPEASGELPEGDIPDDEATEATETGDDEGSEADDAQAESEESEEPAVVPEEPLLEDSSEAEDPAEIPPASRDKERE